eukprot:CAMPEP_0194254406 /NCGR_PEP_ID=MMETSP0158-20130606/32097_1 /TAXON_ID=33649 /ORGANISM="Thalassionema nitzschioides, Strain L26-B" /LENGTH=143 /DNA_ID=CAMNT_0038992431 /DNA_START=1 /DNA_END=429 /DNA_ORIENTATION=+
MEAEKDFSEILGYKRNRHEPTEGMEYTSTISHGDSFDRSRRRKKARREEERFHTQDFAVIPPSDVEDTESIHSVHGSDQTVPAREWWKKVNFQENADYGISTNTTCFICSNTFQGTTSPQTSKGSDTLLKYFSCAAKRSPQIK